MTVTVSISVDTKAARKALLQLGPEEHGRRMRAGMNESLGYLQAEVQGAMPVDLGIGRGSIFTDIRGTVPDITGVVASPQAHVAVLELGRRPGGRMPPVDAIEGWARRHGMPGAGFVIARAIARRGTKAIGMFANAAAKGGPTVEAIFARHLRFR